MKKAGLIICMALLLTGCGSVELTEQESDIIAEYAASTVLKYDVNYQKKLHVSEKTKEEKEEVKEEVKEEPQEDVKQETNEENEQNINEEQQSQQEDIVQNIEEAIGLSGIDISYQGYEVTDYYPNEQENPGFIMYAGSNSQLVVIKMQATNVGTQENEVGMLSLDTDIRLVLNNGMQIQAQRTAFPSDLYNWKGKMQPGETKDIILVGEISNDFGTNIDKVEVIIKKGEEIKKTSLQ